MPDILVTRSRSNACFTAMSETGRRWLMINIGENPVIVQVDYMEDLIEDLKKADLIVED